MWCKLLLGVGGLLILLILRFFVRSYGLFKWGCWGWHLKCFLGFHKFKHECEIVGFSENCSWDTCERCGLTIHINSLYEPTNVNIGTSHW